MKYLPNKKIWVFLIFVLLVFAGWFYFAKQKKYQSEYIANKQENSSVSIIVGSNLEVEKDNDEDGLKDWEEALWKTDPTRKDTDGDGTDDNEEIKSNRDPLKPGPNDKIVSKIEDLTKKDDALAIGNSTLTAAYAKKFLMNYMLLKQAKGELTKEDKQSLVDSIINDVKAQGVQDEYEISDLKIIQNNSKELAEKYAAKIKKALIEDTYSATDDLKIFDSLMSLLSKKENSPEEIKITQTLRYSAQKYKELANVLISFADVPVGVSKFHLEAVNSVNNISLSVEIMSGAKTDSLKAVMGRSLYVEQGKRLFEATNRMQEFFDDYGIKIFKQ